MDIKDFILVGGGILIVLVIAHGFWIAYRAKREPYRLDIVPDLIPDHVDDMERLRGELPNGGARVIRKIDEDLIPEQDSLDLQPPNSETAFGQQAEPTPTLMDVAEPRKPRVFQAPPRHSVSAREMQNDEISEQPAQRQEVQEDLPLSERLDRMGEQEDGAEIDAAQIDAAQIEPVVSKETSTARIADVQLVTEPRVREQPIRTSEPPAEQAAANDDSPSLDRTVEELLIINVVASKGHRFLGEDIVRALRGQGLTYGEMNIFHRKDPMTKAKQFSIASLVEPGTFDLSDLEALNSPGMSFFLQLPGPEDATDAFDDMVATAQHIAFELGGELRDEQMSVLTGQTREHMRQRIADFARRRLSARA